MTIKRRDLGKMKGILCWLPYTRILMKSSYFTSASTFNAGIKHEIVSEICSVPDCTFSEDEVKHTEESCEDIFSVKKSWFDFSCSSKKV